VGAMWLVGGARLRRGWWGAVVVALLVGVVGAVVFATAAGARRSGSALGRFEAFSRPSTMEVSAGEVTAAQVAQFSRSPGVAAVAVLHPMAVAPRGASNVKLAAAVDNTLGTVLERPRVVAGRLADPNRADELNVGESLAARLHLRVGGVLDGTSMTPQQLRTIFRGQDPGAPAGPRLRWTIVGIVRRPLDLGDLAQTGGVMVLTPAFDRAYRDMIANFGTVLRIRTRRGAADVPTVSATARAMFGKSNSFSASSFSVKDVAIESHGASDAINVITVALWVFCLVTALAGLVTISIVVTRDLAQVTSDNDTLQALGFTRRERAAANAPRLLFVAVVGSLIAGVVAIAASPLFPVGIARRADPNPGLHPDWFTLGLGTLALLAVTVLVGGLASIRNASRPDGRTMTSERSPSMLADRAAAAGLRPTVVNGLRMALQAGRGDRAVPVRSALVGAAFGAAGITAVLTFGASLHQLTVTPSQYGTTWDFQAPDNSNNGCTTLATCRSSFHSDFGLQHVAGVSDVAAVIYTPVQVNSRPVTGWGFTPIRGNIPPEIVAGRPPETSDEIALGTQTMSALHLHIGAVAQVTGGGHQHTYQVVGRAVFPRLGGSDIQPLADGAAFTGDGLAPIIDINNSNRYLLGRFAPGVDRATVMRRLDRIHQFYVPADQAFFVNDQGAARPTPPPEVDRLRHIGWLAPTLATLLALLATIAVGHALIMSVRRRRRELALLKVLGFNRQQVRATIAWQTTTITTIGLVIGIPTGIIIGRYAWNHIAASLGIAATPVIPAVAIVAAAALAIVALNTIAAIPATSAARTKPATALHTE
jgi:hypothetical protein